MDNQDLWKAVLSELELSISGVNYSTWIKPLNLIAIEDRGEGKSLTIIQCPSPYHKHMVEQRYHAQIQKSLERITEQKTEVVFEVGKKKSSPEAELFAPLFSQTGVGNTKSGAHNLNPRLTFETYVVGSSNNFAHAAAQGVVKSPGKKYNPLFIYGGVGLGKTHLMHAVGHELFKLHPDWNILYISAETFANDLISSLQSKKTTTFKKRYRSCDLLMVDDIQFISGKEFTQEEFFHTFNELHMNERQIILSSDRPPQEMAKIEERLSSRFMGGLTVDIQPPDFEMRVAILTQKAKEMGLSIPPESISLVAEKTATNIRELEGVFRKVVAVADQRGGEISGELVREFFGVEQERRTQRIRPSLVINKTAQYFEYKTGDLTGKSRKAPITNARHIAMYLIKTELDIPYEQIGELFGGRDHTTAMHGVLKVTEGIKTEAEVAKHIADIKHMVFSQ